MERVSTNGSLGCSRVAIEVDENQDKGFGERQKLDGDGSDDVVGDGDCKSGESQDSPGEGRKGGDSPDVCASQCSDVGYVNTNLTVKVPDKNAEPKKKKKAAKSTSLCVICCKTSIKVADKRPCLELLFEHLRIETEVGKDFLGTCRDCRFILKEYGDLFEDWKALELELGRRIKEIANIARCASHVATRREAFKTWCDSLDNRNQDKTGTSLKQFRSNLRRQCKQVVTEALPKVQLAWVKQDPGPPGSNETMRQIPSSSICTQTLPPKLKDMGPEAKRVKPAGQKRFSGYYVYMRERRLGLVGMYPEMSSTDVTQTLAKEWSGMDMETKQSYINIAAADELEYEREQVRIQYVSEQDDDKDSSEDHRVHAKKPFNLAKGKYELDHLEYKPGAVKPLLRPHRPYRGSTSMEDSDEKRGRSTPPSFTIQQTVPAPTKPVVNRGSYQESVNIPPQATPPQRLHTPPTFKKEVTKSMTKKESEEDELESDEKASGESKDDDDNSSEEKSEKKTKKETPTKLPTRRGSQEAHGTQAQVPLPPVANFPSTSQSKPALSTSKPVLSKQSSKNRVDNEDGSNEKQNDSTQDDSVEDDATKQSDEDSAEDGSSEEKKKPKKTKPLPKPTRKPEDDELEQPSSQCLKQAPVVGDITAIGGIIGGLQEDNTNDEQDQYGPEGDIPAAPPLTLQSPFAPSLEIQIPKGTPAKVPSGVPLTEFYQGQGNLAGAPASGPGLPITPQQAQLAPVNPTSLLGLAHQGNPQTGYNQPGPGQPLQQIPGQTSGQSPGQGGAPANQQSDQFQQGIRNPLGLGIAGQEIDSLASKVIKDKMAKANKFKTIDGDLEKEDRPNKRMKTPQKRTTPQRRTKKATPQKKSPLGATEYEKDGEHVSVFSKAFLRHNNTREAEFKALRQAVIIANQQNATLKTLVDKRTADIAQGVIDMKREKVAQVTLKNNLNYLRSALVSRLSTVPLPGKNEPPTLETIDDYMKELKTLKERMNKRMPTSSSIARFVEAATNAIGKLEL